MRIRLRVEKGPVADATREPADVYVVKGVGRIRPLAGRVVDFEPDVRGCGGALRGAQIAGQDVGVGEGIGHVDGPEAGAGADVEDGSGVGDGGEVELVVEGEEPEVVDDGFVVGVGFVVGGVVGAFAVGVVAAAVFVAVAGYA